MKALLLRLFAIAASRVVTPLVLLSFLLLYTGTAFVSDEPLSTLMGLMRTTFLLPLLLALIPLNCALRIVIEIRNFRALRQLITARGRENFSQDLFDETVHLPTHTPLAQLQSRLETFGYCTRLSGNSLAAWKGVTLFPAKMLLLAAMFCLFSGILLSTTLRSSHKVAVVEGEPFPLSVKGQDRVERIEFREQPGLFLDKTLSIVVAGADGTRRVFGIYPPSFYREYFVYPRFLGIAPLIRFSAPELPAGFESFFILMLYPVGKEDSAVIPDSSYRIVFSMAEPDDGGDPFRTGRVKLHFRIMKRDVQVAAGNTPMGEEFSADGYRLSFPEFRRVVATDLVRDYGVVLIWAGAVNFCFSLVFWLPVRLFSPRCEMLFMEEGDAVDASSRSEGGRTRHGGVFHEAVDSLASDESDCRIKVPLFRNDLT